MIQRKDWDLSEYSYKGSEDQGNLYIGKPSTGGPFAGWENETTLIPLTHWPFYPCCVLGRGWGWGETTVQM